MDIKVDNKALIQQVLGSNPGKNVIIINMGTTVNEASKIECGNTLWDIINNLPEPRMENLKQLAIEECFKHIGTKIGSASFLGISLRRARGRLNRAEEKTINITPLQLNP